ncbi:16S rRNA processing protein RimM [Burkholderiales bacterium JOSHI_001]|nr:16S rRNA processing protein RimM [Burkholderiales bacterium JOSHI_001]
MNAPQTDDAWPTDAVEVGRIVDAWGLKGGFKVQTYSSDPQALFGTKRWYLRPADVPLRPTALAAAASPRVPLPSLLRIQQAKEQGAVVVATAHEITDRNAAEGLKGARVFVSRTAFPTPDEGEFYWIDLIGLDVVNRDGAALGRVVGLIETGASCVLRIQPEGEGEERLVPFVTAFVDTVSLADRRITVDWGLDY